MDKTATEIALEAIADVADWTADGRICGSNDHPAAVQVRREVVNAIFGALERADMVVAPREPTLDMLGAGQVQVNLLKEPNPTNAFEFLSREEVDEIWRAMIDQIPSIDLPAANPSTGKSEPPPGWVGEDGE